MDEVDQLMLNARLRDELEPFLDDSLVCLQTRHFPTANENEFLASMLAWERAPVLPIGQWFTPEIVLPHPDSLSHDQLHRSLWDTIHKLYEKRIVLDFTDHLTDRQLYTIIYRDILSSSEKKIESPRNYLHWDCANTGDDPQTWLRFYASYQEREAYALETGEDLPPAEDPPYRRKMPSKPL
jgi:hypothetical protein